MASPSSTASIPDWVTKGCHIHIHIHIDRIELAVRPDHLGQVVFRKVFSPNPNADFEVASRNATDLREDSAFRARLRDSIARAMDYLMGVTGRPRNLARGRLRKFRLLLVALDRMEAS